MKYLKIHQTDTIKYLNVISIFHLFNLYLYYTHTNINIKIENAYNWGILLSSLETMSWSRIGDKTSATHILMTYNRNFIINPQSLKTENRC